MRLEKHEWYMRIAEVVALRGTCLRRQVGCVLVDYRGHILSTGYNGVPRGAKHCNQEASALLDTYDTIYPFSCPAAKEGTGSNLGGCRAIHAEQNALLQCPDVEKIMYCYTTVEPCEHCTKLLLNTGCQAVLFRDRYDANGLHHWVSADRPPNSWGLVARP